MSVISSLSLNEEQKQSFVKKIKERVLTNRNFKADFNKLKANKVDFSAINSRAVQTMQSTLGKQITVPLKTVEGLDGELAYVEVNGSWLYHVATKTKNDHVLKKFRNSVSSNEKFGILSNHLIEKGYNLKAGEDYVIQNNKVLKDQEDKIFTQDLDAYAVPIFQNLKRIGMLIIGDNQSTPIVAIDDKRMFVNENGEIVTIQSSTCNVSWTRCMGDCLPGCDSWQGCVLFFGSCLSACCGCTSIAPCILCGACLVVGVGCLFKCRMCVPGAARPEECPN